MIHLSDIRAKITKKRVIIAAVATALVAALVFTAIAIASRGYQSGKYNKTKYSCSGGNATENANLNSLTYLCFENAINIELQFISGSGEEAVSSPVPQYKVEFLSSPMRLKLTLSDLSYWDYVVAGMPTDLTGIILGAFQQSPEGENTDTVLYFSLSTDVTYKVNEADDVLSISLLSAEKSEASTAWHILCDLFYEYRSGTMPGNYFTPTLCSDRISVLMISEPYKTAADAQQAMDTYLTGDFEGTTMRLIELNGYDLPNYSENTDDFALLNESVLSVDGAKTTLPLFCSDARFLCWLPDGTGALFAKPEESGEMLYVADKVGNKQQLIPESFATVVQATYSADGKSLAFVEQTDDVSLVTLLDIENGKLTVVGGTDGAQILGSSIISIALNNDGTKLYCLSGERVYSLKEYNVGTQEIAIMAANIVTESKITYLNGYLYYCDIVDEMESIVRINTVEVMPRETLTYGSSFDISPDGEFMAVITEDYDTAVCALRIVYLNDLTSIMILDDMISSEFFIDADGKNLFYIEETGDEEFYYQIMRYDTETGETKSCAQCINAVFFPSNISNEIVISVIYSADGVTRPVTYLADFTSIEANAQNTDFTE